MELAQELVFGLVFDFGSVLDFGLGHLLELELESESVLEPERQLVPIGP